MKPGASIVCALVMFISGHAPAAAGGPSARARPTQDAGSARPAPAAPVRIISLIPAVTETLFAIGAGPQVVAVSSFDRYPPDVEKLQRVGALIDPDVERILSLRPDLVIVYASQSDLRAQLQRAQIPTYVYSHAGLADIGSTIRDVGIRVGRGPAAAQVAASIEGRIQAVRTRVAGLPRPSTLVVFEREPFTLRGIYASGGVGFIHDMLDAAGGANIFADVKREAVQATTELILARGPAVVIELRSSVASEDTRRRELAAWSGLGAVPAVRTGRVYLFGDPRMTIAGPRVAEVVEILGRTLHPGAFSR
ncbi:MAG: helical backbone metal receptor [Acidobacteriota bacterium]|nr:helical backbone metal receptor [Acidobacteriota bacterium]